MHVNPDNKTDFINIVTLGCSKNTVDSEVLIRQLKANNIRIIHNTDTFKAKTVIINTCGFINDAKQESINTILQFVHAKEQGLINQVYVIGCLVERYKKDLEKEIPDVDKYFGVNDLETIIKHLKLNYNKQLTIERCLTTPAHYAYLKISEGCDRTCAFCAIPLMRGRFRSKSPDVVLDEAKYLADKGVKELILIAQDLTSYGLDIRKRQLLAELLDKISDIDSFSWIRLHYCYPAGFPKDVITIMKEKRNICRYLDIPIQHASDKILKLMRRGYNQQQICELIAFIRDEIPGIALRTTVLTGHPGEGEKEFQELLEFIEKMKFDRLGVFKYSEEEDTYASEHYENLIPENIKSERADEIISLQSNIYKILNNNKIGKTFKVLIDSRVGEYYMGRTEADSPEVDHEVFIPVTSGKLNIGHFYDVVISKAGEYDLFGMPG
jgi:ribosomal protein S12 methylthiotransferase